MNYLFVPLFLFITCLPSFSQTQVNKPAHIPFQLSPNGHILMNASVNGVEGNFVFDTGAGLHLLTKNFANKITDLEKTHHFHVGHRATGEEIKSTLWKTKSIDLNGYATNKDFTAVYDIDFPFDGLLSLTSFEQRPITINFEKNELVVESESSFKKILSGSKHVLPLTVYKNGATLGIGTTVVLENELPLNVHLDSGAGFGLYRFSTDYLDELSVDSTVVEHKKIKSPFVPDEGNDYYFAELEKLSDHSNLIQKQPVSATFITGLIYEGIMGIRWLGDVITIDLENERLIIQNERN